jgi:parvulin-like peptidyl-prolyl isomerase
MILAAGAAAPGAWGEEPDVLARVNGDPITRAEVERMLADPLTRRMYLRAQGRRKPESEELSRWVLRQLILQRLTLQEGARRNVTVGERDLDEAVAAWRGRFKTAAKFQRWLKVRRLDERALREAMRRDLMVSRATAALLEGLRPADEEVRAYYEAHEAAFTLPEEARLRIIAVKDSAAADEIVAAVEQGEDFERLAAERSMEARALEAGDNRWTPLSTLPPPLRQAVETLEPGEISGPLQGGAEFIVVRLEERRPARTKTLEEARPEIEQRLLPRRRREALQAWLTAEEERARIELFVEAGGKQPGRGGPVETEGWANASALLDAVEKRK